MLRICKTLTFIALMVSSHYVSAQDLLANHAPSDRKLTDLKAIKINNTSAFIDLHNPAGNIYSTWDDKSALVAPGVLPPNFKVDLRDFSMPTKSRIITSNFGPRWGREHKGIDIKVYIGDTICAAFDGKVRIVKYNAGGWGYYVVIRHPNGLETLYGHLSKQLVKEDQIVRAGQPIGLGGNTGVSTGSHLHFETRLLGQAINPARMFNFAIQDVTGDYYVVNSGSIQNSKATAVASALIVKEDLKENNLRASTSFQQHKIINSVKEVPLSLTSGQSSKTSSKSALFNSITYVVKDGDNLYRIAVNHGLTLEQLCKLNGLKPNSSITRGQVLKCS